MCGDENRLVNVYSILSVTSSFCILWGLFVYIFYSIISLSVVWSIVGAHIVSLIIGGLTTHLLVKYDFCKKNDNNLTPPTIPISPPEYVETETESPPSYFSEHEEIP